MSPVATNMVMGKSYARAWLIVLGVVLLLLGVLGFVTPSIAGATLNGGEMWLHLVLGVVTLGVAFGVKEDAMLNTIAMAFGVVYLLVGVVGFVMPTIGSWSVGVVDNVLHLLVGVVTLGAWWMSKDVAMGGSAGRPAM